jgi:hypothetical protein
LIQLAWPLCLTSHFMPPTLYSRTSSHLLPCARSHPPRTPCSAPIQISSALSDQANPVAAHLPSATHPDTRDPITSARHLAPQPSVPPQINFPGFWSYEHYLICRLPALPSSFSLLSLTPTSKPYTLRQPPSTLSDLDVPQAAVVSDLCLSAHLLMQYTT